LSAPTEEVVKEEEETVVEEGDKNGEQPSGAKYMNGENADERSSTIYNITTTARSRSQQDNSTNLYSGTKVHAGANHQVSSGRTHEGDLAPEADLASFMQTPETLLPLSTIDDPTERFISVVKFYLSGWHIKPA